MLLIQSILFFSAHAQKKITEYRVSFGKTDYKGESWIILRQFKNAGSNYFLMVDPNGMNTKTLISSEVGNVIPYSFQQLTEKMANTPYVKALLKSRNLALPLQDAGITHAFPSEKGITLTIDLCPSHKELDRDIFTSLMSTFKNTERPIPVALSLTGRFLLSHESDVQWLKNLVSSGEINITWINHTYNHHYNPVQPLIKNFLLTAGTDLDFELLALEQAMIEQDLLPSVFFRFPGLISNQQLVDRVTVYGLIPIGSDAWLAKGQQAKPGSLVLIHGNGNEPIGVQDFIRLLHDENSTVRQKQWLRYDLRTSISDEF